METLIDGHQLARSNYALNLEEIIQGREILESRPPYFQIDLIGLCNIRPYCRMCSIDVTDVAFHRGITEETVLSYMDFIEKSLQVTNCSTGEPLLHRKLGRFLELFHQRGKKFGFSSNGLLLDERRSKELLKFGSSLAINFSLDAATAETFARIRSDDFDRVIGNIRNFCAARRALPAEQRPEIALCFIPMRLNQHEIPAFFELGAELGVGHIELRPLIYMELNKVVTHNGFTFNYHEQLLSYTELERCHRLALEAAERTGVVLNWQHEVSGDDPYVLFRPPELPSIETPCTMPWTFLLPYHDGRTVACCYMVESVGDWRQGGLEKVWNGEKLRGIRRSLAAGQLARECLNSPSCPLVKKKHHEERDGRLEELVTRSSSADGEIRFRVADPDFPELIGFGVYPVEEPGGGEASFRWLADIARLKLPRPFPDQSFMLGLRLRTGCNDPRLGTMVCRIRIDETPAGEVVLGQEWHTWWFRVESSPHAFFEIDFECPNAFVPAQLGLSEDRRTLGAVLGDPSVRLRRPWRDGLAAGLRRLWPR